MWFADKHARLLYSSFLSRKSISVMHCAGLVYWLFSRYRHILPRGDALNPLKNYPSSVQEQIRKHLRWDMHAATFFLVLLFSNDTIHVSSTTVIPLRLLYNAMHFRMSHAPAEIFAVEHSSPDRWQSVHTRKMMKVGNSMKVIEIYKSLRCKVRFRLTATIKTASLFDSYKIIKLLLLSWESRFERL